MRCCGTSLHFLHAEPVLVRVAGHCDGNAEDDHHDPVRVVVRASAEWNAVAWSGPRVWRCRSRGRDTEEGEDGQGEEGYWDEGGIGGGDQGCGEGEIRGEGVVEHHRAGMRKEKSFWGAWFIDVYVHVL